MESDIGLQEETLVTHNNRLVILEDADPPPPADTTNNSSSFVASDYLTKVECNNKFATLLDFTALYDKVWTGTNSLTYVQDSHTANITTLDN